MDLAVELQNENDETQGLFFVLLSGLLSSCTAVVNTHVQPAKNSHFLGEKKAENKKDQFQFITQNIFLLAQNEQNFVYVFIFRHSPF